MSDPILKDEGDALHFEIRTSVQRIMAHYDKVFEARYQTLANNDAALRELLLALQLEQAAIARIDARQDRLDERLTNLFDLVEELKARTVGQ